MTSGEEEHPAKAAKGLSRRQSRRKAFELLFELNYRPDLCAETILHRTFEDADVQDLNLIDEDNDGYVAGVLDDGASLFIKELVHAVKDHEDKLDHELEQYPHDWSYDRIGVAERVLLQLALAEMVYLGTSYKVVINETLDMAKLYAQEEARRFINGILGAAVRNLDEIRTRAEEVSEE